MPQPEETGVIVRLATVDDAPELTHLLLALNGPPITPGQVSRRLRAIQGIETVFLAEAGGRLVGFASLRLVPYLSDDVPLAELTELYVDTSYRRRGIGRALVARVEALAHERGATSLHLLTGLRNAEAQAFYRALGFSDLALAMAKSLRGTEATGR